MSGRRLLAHLAACWLAAAVNAGAAESDDPPPARESELKAAFLLNFLEFVAFPDGPPARWRLCLAVNSELAGALKTYRDKKVRGRPFEVAHPVRDEQLAACHLVFIGHEQRANLPEVVARLALSPVLVVTEARDGAQLGAGIGFVWKEDGRLAFDVSRTATEGQGLKPSSQLLRLARRVF